VGNNGNLYFTTGGAFNGPDAIGTSAGVAGILNSTPEPSSLPLLVLAAFAIAFVRIRRSRTA
jgi:hypothetical protein